jgi:hypothetical protein
MGTQPSDRARSLRLHLLSWHNVYQHEVSKNVGYILPCFNFSGKTLHMELVGLLGTAKNVKFWNL